VDTNVLEEHAASIFRAEVSRLRNWLCYKDKSRKEVAETQEKG
jgi:hypothetical protein